MHFSLDLNISCSLIGPSLDPNKYSVKSMCWCSLYQKPKLAAHERHSWELLWRAKWEIWHPAPLHHRPWHWRGALVYQTIVSPFLVATFTNGHGLAGYINVRLIQLQSFVPECKYNLLQRELEQVNNDLLLYMVVAGLPGFSCSVSQEGSDGICWWFWHCLH